MRIISANLNGIRSAATKGFFDWLPTQHADVVCVQELKAQAADLKPEFIQCDGLTGAFHYAEKKGYSGVGVYTRQAPQRIIEGPGVAEFDLEGRYIEADYGNLAVISLYQPSGSQDGGQGEVHGPHHPPKAPRSQRPGDERRPRREEGLGGGDPSSGLPAFPRGQPITASRL